VGRGAKMGGGKKLKFQSENTVNLSVNGNCFEDDLSKKISQFGVPHAVTLALCTNFIFLPQMAEEMVTLAYESGINVFDTAEVYAAGK
jgi:hypothetical protein